MDPLRPLFEAPDAFRSITIEVHPDRDGIERREGPCKLALLSPWTFRDDVIDVPQPREWVAFVKREHGTSISENEIAEKLTELLRICDGPLRKNPALRVVYDLDAVIEELKQSLKAP